MATKKETETVVKKMTPAQLRNENESLKEELNKIKTGAYCYLCDKFKPRAQFNKSTDPLSKSGLAPICKKCAYDIALKKDNEGNYHEPDKESVKKALFYLNKPYLQVLFDASIKETESQDGRKKNLWTAYTVLVAMPNYIGMTWKDSDELYNYNCNKELDKNNISEIDEDYIKCKNDVIKLLGYDPFSKESIEDQPLLYANMRGLLDSNQEANEDMMRNQACVSISRGFLQMSKLDDAITKLMIDIDELKKNSATIKSLQDSKSKISGIIKDLAAENCISLKNNKNNKKGENTWTGKIKKIKDLDLRDGRVNGFDIETSKAMRQVMDLSNKSIIQELRLTESDWAEMVADQRQMVVKLQSQLDSYIEISRILLNENLDLKDFIKEENIDDKGYHYADLEDLFSQFYVEEDSHEELTNSLKEEEISNEKESDNSDNNDSENQESVTNE